MNYNSGNNNQIGKMSIFTDADSYPQNEKRNIITSTDTKSRDLVNPAQKQAIEHINGPMMVLAGPGSGKTFVITRRICHLIENGIAPENILVITFTKASALEMQERFQKLMGDVYAPVTFGTFHAIYFRILKMVYHYDLSNIITEAEKKKFLRIACENVMSEIYDGSLTQQLLEQIGKIKNEGISPNDCDFPSIDKEQFTEIYYEYDALLRENKKIDFEDMVLLCKELFEQSETELRKWQDIYQYILIDEFQDINQMQYDVIRKIAGEKNNLFVVGDDDQSIYGFRGSKPEIMLHFPENNHNCKEVLLNINYRSKKNIVEMATDFIGNNKKRFYKKIKANECEGELINLYAFPAKEVQFEELIKLMQMKIGKYNYSNMAVIFRTNGGANLLIAKLMEHKIPFVFKEKQVSVFQKEYALDIKAFLSFVFKERKREYLLRFLNKPVRYLKRDLFQSSSIDIQQMIRMNNYSGYVRNELQKLCQHFIIVQNMNLYAAFHYFLKAMGYESYLQKQCKEKGNNYEECRNDLYVIGESLKRCNRLSEWEEYIEEYEKNIEVGQKSNDSVDGVNIVTMHGSKGLEYKMVILPDLNEGNVPQGKAISEQEMEEERRVFYVAMTRAKEELILSYVEGTKENRLIKSRFLKQMKKLNIIQVEQNENRMAEAYSSSSSSTSSSNS